MMNLKNLAQIFWGMHEACKNGVGMATEFGLARPVIVEVEGKRYTLQQRVMTTCDSVILYAAEEHK